MAAAVDLKKPVVLVVLDGWGYRPEREGNAVLLADTPNWDRLWAGAPRTLLDASGVAVGLPEGQMGNSEVGHLNIGAGRVVKQELVRIGDAVADGSIADATAFKELEAALKKTGGKRGIASLCIGGGEATAVGIELV